MIEIMTDIMHAKCLKECLENITILIHDTYMIHYYHCVYPWFKVSASESGCRGDRSVVIFWYCSSAESCLRPREMWEKSTMSEN